jgi:hypothetical protein
MLSNVYITKIGKVVENNNALHYVDSVGSGEYSVLVGQNTVYLSARIQCICRPEYSVFINLVPRLFPLPLQRGRSVRAKSLGTRLCIYLQEYSVFVGENTVYLLARIQCICRQEYSVFVGENTVYLSARIQCI